MAPVITDQEMRCGILQFALSDSVFLSLSLKCVECRFCFTVNIAVCITTPIWRAGYLWGPEVNTFSLSISIYLQLHVLILCTDATAHFEADLSGVSEGSNPSQVPPLGVDIPFTDRGLFINDLAISISCSLRNDEECFLFRSDELAFCRWYALSVDPLLITYGRRWYQ